MKQTIKLTVAIVGAATIALSASASAGGLFGEGGLIGGDVGNFLDKNLEKPILTPIAKGAGQVLGSSGGALANGPTLNEDEDLDEDVSPAPSGREETILFDDGNTALGMPGQDSGIMTPADGPGGVITIDFGNGDLGTAPGVDELDPDTTTIVFE